MNRRQAVAALLASLTSPTVLAGQNAAQALLPLAHGDWAALRGRLTGQATVVHLWGVTCAPCLVELPAWSKFVSDHPRIPVLFVHCDPVPWDKVLAALRRAGLDGARHYAVQGRVDERLQFEFDSDWGGELPRTLLIDPQGEQRGISGSVDFAAILAWWRATHPGGRGARLDAADVGDLT